MQKFLEIFSLLKFHNNVILLLKFLLKFQNLISKIFKLHINFKEIVLSIVEPLLLNKAQIRDFNEQIKKLNM